MGAFTLADEGERGRLKLALIGAWLGVGHGGIAVAPTRELDSRNAWIRS